MSLPRPGSAWVLDLQGLEEFLGVLRAEGFNTIGPTVRDGAVLYGPVQGVRDLPAGWTDRQNEGTYRLERSGSPALFGYTTGMLAWKAFLYPPGVRLWQAERNGSLRFQPLRDETPPLALIGVRPCELAALELQDAMLLKGPHQDPVYRARRERAFIVAVSCTRPGGTCFCASTGTGPGARRGFDLALVEETEPDHRFLVEVGSERGGQVLSTLGPRPAREAEVAQAMEAVEQAAAAMPRRLETGSLHEAFTASVESPVWEEIASRCLACGNCTMVCPVCSCHTAAESTSLDGTRAERTRRWDSCFSLAFSYIHGGPVRTSRASRYRQWLFHKLGGEPLPGRVTSGCVGCGRCIAWCPAGIDLTQVASQIVDAWAAGPDRPPHEPHWQAGHRTCPPPAFAWSASNGVWSA